MANGTSANVTLGPGWLYVAPVGTTEPVSASAALPSAWRPVGYTEDGSVISYALTVQKIDVAEEFDPIRYATTAREGSIAFKIAEATRRNLALALNAGAAAVNDASALEPPDPGAEVRVMIVHDSVDVAGALAATNSRWVFRQCLNGEALAISLAKAPAKALLPVKFNLEKPSGLAPFKVFPSASGTVGLVA